MNTITNYTKDRNGSVMITHRSVTSFDMMNQETRKCFENIQYKIMRGEVVPDEGTLEDIEWMRKYIDFGNMISMHHPNWGRCNNCRNYRLGFFQVMDLSHKCYKCCITDKTIQDAGDLKNLNMKIVQNFLNTGEVDPTIDWKSYQDIIDEENERIEAWRKIQLVNPLLMSESDRKKAIEKILNANNLDANGFPKKE